MQTVTLQAEDFKTIHNTLCELRTMSRASVELQKLVEQFEEGLKDAYEQDNAIFSSKMDYFHSFKEMNGLESIWSVYELDVHGFLQAHPFPSDAFVVYRNHWGKNTDKHYPVSGTTWGDVYRAADLAIRESGDAHHIFIEGFEVKGNELHMYTGS